MGKTAGLETSELEGKVGLIVIAQHRFAAFVAKFKRPPGPQEPLFFNESEKTPVKADLYTTRRQMAEAARAGGIRLNTVLRFLGHPLRISVPRRLPRATHRATSRGPRTEMDRWRPTRSAATSSWSRFLSDDLFRRRHAITPSEVQALSKVALLGRVQNQADLLFILKMIRKAEGAG